MRIGRVGDAWMGKLFRFSNTGRFLGGVSVFVEALDECVSWFSCVGLFPEKKNVIKLSFIIDTFLIEKIYMTFKIILTISLIN